MEINGKIKVINETKSFGGNGFRKREMIITSDEQFPQHIMVEFSQDKCDLLDNHKEGDLVKVGINLRGREWVNPKGESKYFNSIQGWSIEKTGGNIHEPVQQQPSNTYVQEDVDTDSMPF